MTTVSAPGKILLAGGYLVLEAPNVGLVIAVDKRFYTTARITRNNDGEEDTPTVPTNKKIGITVKSPQFGQEWKYFFDQEALTLTVDPSNATSNEFVQKTLRVSLLYLLPKTADNNIVALDLTIQADNDFYSLVPHLEQRQLGRTLPDAQSLPAFLPAAKDQASGKIFKTGLGSSACLVTSLVGALCHALAVATNNNNNLIFNLAQICHCHAQGKVGSGFDVSAACHGSHIYQRFPKQQLADLLVALDDDTTKSSGTEIRPLLSSAVESTWEGGVTAPLQLQGGDGLLQVTMADVSGGSESPSMARTVLAWKKKQMEEKNGNSEAPIPHWDDLIQTNQQIVDLLQQVAGLPATSPEDKQTLAKISLEKWNSLPDKLAETGRLLFELKQACLKSRQHLKAMGNAAGVPIEPDEQTALADATLGVPGVIAALVPGAGGYDALACLYINDPQVQASIGDLWASWSDAQVCPLTVQAAEYGQGVRVETSPPSP